MREVGETVARELEETGRVHQGVYAMLGGPHFESPAEVKLLRTLGADLVGESGLGLLSSLHLSPVLSPQG